MYLLWSKEIDMATRVQFLDKAVRISHGANTLGEKFEANYFPSNYEEIVKADWTL